MAPFTKQQQAETRAVGEWLQLGPANLEKIALRSYSHG